MSAEENLAVMRRYFNEAWNQQRIDLLDELVAPDYVNHLSPPETPRGPAGLKPIFAAVWATFPDVQFSMDEMLVAGDKVITRWSMRATHRGDFLGVPASGKTVTNYGISIDRVVDGKIVEHWRASDDLNLLQQLGTVRVVPPEG